MPANTYVSSILAPFRPSCAVTTLAGPGHHSDKYRLENNFVTPWHMQITSTMSLCSHCVINVTAMSSRRETPKQMSS